MIPRSEWLSIQQCISEHPDFERYFLRCHEDLPWSENLDLLDSADSRIPFDVLDSNEAETVYKNHVNALQAELEMREWVVDTLQCDVGCSVVSEVMLKYKYFTLQFDIKRTGYISL